MNAENWKKHFKVPEDSSSLNLLEVLQKNIINETEYQKWASCYYNIPVLQSTYFDAHPSIQKNLWEKVKNKATWSASLLPIAEWQGILYIACLEPKSLPFHQPVVWLIASQKMMQTLWEKIQEDHQQKKPVQSEITHSQIPSIKNDDIIIEEEPRWLNGIQHGVQHGIQHISRWFTSSPKNKKHSDTSISQQKKKPVFTKLEKPLNHSDHHSIHVDSTNSLKKEMPTQSLFKKKTSAPDTTQLQPDADVNVQKVTLQSTPSVDVSEEKKKPKMKDIKIEELKESPMKVKQKVSTPTHTSTPTPKHTSTSTPTHTSTPTPTHISMPTHTPTHKISPIRSILEKTTPHVQSYILFQCKKQLFIPIKWSYDLKPLNKKPVPVHQPSLFRISYISKQPYFGHLTAVSMNTVFFENWGFERLPEHVTFIPFLNQEGIKVVGGYLGINQSKNHSLDFLNLITKIVKPLNQFYHKNNFKKAS